MPVATLDACWQQARKGQLCSFLKRGLPLDCTQTKRKSSPLSSPWKNPGQLVHGPSAAVTGGLFASLSELLATLAEEVREVEGQTLGLLELTFHVFDDNKSDSWWSARRPQGS